MSEMQSRSEKEQSCLPADLDYSPEGIECTDEDMRKMNKKELLNYLSVQEENNSLDSIQLKDFILRSEYLALVEEIGEEEAIRKYQVATKNLENIVSKLKRKKLQKISEPQMFEEILSNHGEYDAKSSFLINLLADGSGNCEATAKLTAILTEEIFGDKIGVTLETLYIQNGENGKIEPHIRTVAKSKKANYILDMPKVRRMTADEANQAKLRPKSIFAKGYLVKNKVLKYEEGEKVQLKDPRVRNVTTDSILDIPNSDKLETQKSQLDKLKPAGEGEREVGDYSFLTRLDNPELAMSIIDEIRVKKRLESGRGIEQLNLENITHISKECAMVFANNFIASNIYLGTSRGLSLSEEEAKGIGSIQAFIHLGIKGDLSPQIAQGLRAGKGEQKPLYLGLKVWGKLPKESARILADNFPSWGMSISTTVPISMNTMREMLNTSDNSELTINSPGMNDAMIRYVLENRKNGIILYIDKLTDKTIEAINNKGNNPNTIKLRSKFTEIESIRRGLEDGNILPQNDINQYGNLDPHTIKILDGLDHQLSSWSHRAGERPRQGLIIRFVENGGLSSIESAKTLVRTKYDMIELNELKNPLSKEILKVIESAFELEEKYEYNKSTSYRFKRRKES